MHMKKTVLHVAYGLRIQKFYIEWYTLRRASNMSFQSYTDDLKNLTSQATLEGSTQTYIIFG